MPTADGRLSCIIYTGNLGDGLRWLLPQSEEFRAAYSLMSYIYYYHDVNYKQFSRTHIESCDLLICHHPSASPFSDPEEYGRLLASFPPHTRKIFLPAPKFPVLWPFHVDHRPAPPVPLYSPFFPAYRKEPGDSDLARGPSTPLDFRGECLSYPFGDQYVLDRLRDGMAPAAIIQEYLTLDVASAADLDGLLRESLAGIGESEQTADIRIADFVANQFTSQRSFSSVTNANNPLFLHVANEVLKILGLGPISKQVLERLQPLVKVEVPVHPSIGRHFVLPYITDETRYLVDRHRFLTFAEYFSGYVNSLATDRVETVDSLPRPEGDLAMCVPDAGGAR